MICKLIFSLIILTKNKCKCANNDLNGTNNLIKSWNASQAANLMESDLRYLSELPLEQLLKVQKSIGDIKRTSSSTDFDYEVDYEAHRLSDSRHNLNGRIINDEFGLERFHNNESATALPLINPNRFDRYLSVGGIFV